MRQTFEFLFIAWSVVGIAVWLWRLDLIGEYERAGGAVPERHFYDPFRILMWGLKTHRGFHDWLRKRGQGTYIRVWWAYWLALGGLWLLLAATR